jgi:2-polyprenyl-6-methoxyphenol hydroxylase-like FAD-dependent oxidoreductase
VDAKIRAMFLLQLTNHVLSRTHSFHAVATCYLLGVTLLCCADMMSAFALPADVTNSNVNSSNSNINNNKVIIIGGGLGGLSLSLGLADLGFQVDIVEKQPNFSRTGATFGIQANGQKALEELSPGIVTDELNKVGLPMDPPTIGIMCGWWNVRDALLNRVLKKKNAICVHNGWMLQNIQDDDMYVKAVFHKLGQDGRDDEDQEQLVLEGCILVGADGVNSLVRSLLGLPSAKHTGVVTWRARVQIPPLNELESGTRHASHGANNKQEETISALRPILENPLKFSVLQLRGPMIYMLFNFNEKLSGTMALVVNVQQQQGDGEAIAKGASPQVMMEANAESDDEKKLIRALLEFADQDGLHNPTPIKVIEPPNEVGAGWGGKGRITIIGDAAHGKFLRGFSPSREIFLDAFLTNIVHQTLHGMTGMRPVSGLGGSMAFEDSVMLCRALAKASSQGTLNDKAGVERALSEFENCRIPRVRKIWVDEWERAEIVYKQKRNMEPWSDEYRAWVYNGV